MDTPQEIIDHFEKMRDVTKRELVLFDKLEYLLLYKAVWEQFLPWDTDKKRVYNVKTRWDGRTEIWLELTCGVGPSVEFRFRVQQAFMSGGDPGYLYGNPHVPDYFTDMLLKRIWGIKQGTIDATRKRKRGKSGWEFKFDPDESYRIIGAEAPDDEVRTQCVSGDDGPSAVED